MQGYGLRPCRNGIKIIRPAGAALARCLPRARAARRANCTGHRGGPGPSADYDVNFSCRDRGQPKGTKMSSTVEQTFTRAGEISAALPSFGGFLLYAKGPDASNTIKTQRSVANGQSWVDVVTYDSDQTAVPVAETTIHAQHRTVCVSKRLRSGARASGSS